MKKIEIRKECVRLRKFSPRNFTPANTTNEEQFSRKAGVETEISLPLTQNLIRLDQIISHSIMMINYLPH